MKTPDSEAGIRAVILLDERVTTVGQDGHLRLLLRRVYKILRPEGSDYGVVTVFLPSNAKLLHLDGWSIPIDGKEYQVKEKDALEFGGGEALYSDERRKVLTIPAARPGSFIGYEYEVRWNDMQEDFWDIQQTIPVLVSRYTLELPAGWDFRMHWRNRSPSEPVRKENRRWEWEVRDIPAVETEPLMPATAAVAVSSTVQFFPQNAPQCSRWSDVSAWYQRESLESLQSTPAIQAKVAELTAGVSSDFEKARRLGAFVQNSVRYVAIAIGKGRYVPHRAGDVLKNQYGDCKDKAALLKTMLQAANIDAYFVLVSTDRGVVGEEIPSIIGFDHVIVAIRLHDTANAKLPAMVSVPAVGTLMLFDPTSTLVPFGEVPPYLQGSCGLIVAGSDGELVHVGLAPPRSNQLLRTASLELGAAGTLEGEVHERYEGALAINRRGALRDVPQAQQKKLIEEFLGQYFTRFEVESLDIRDLNDVNQSLEVNYRLRVTDYALHSGDLLLLRPRTVGEKALSTLEGKRDHARQYPVAFESTSLETDSVDISLPPGYVVDEVPKPSELDAGIASYRSRVFVNGRVLHYEREYTVNNVLAGGNAFARLNEFYRSVAAEEKSVAVLKRSP